MKAVVYNQYGPPEVLQLKEVDQPTPQNKQLKIKVNACAITMGDCELRSPAIPTFTWFIVRLVFGLFHPKIKTLGAYVSGTVVAKGKETNEFELGDQVYGICGKRFGGYAEYVCLDEKGPVTKTPSNMSMSEAAPVGLGLEGLHFFEKAQLKKGEKLLINGAGGGIGTYALQLAQYYGAEVTAVDTGDKLEALKGLGATACIDYTSTPLRDHQEKYDVILDVVGTIGHLESMQLLNKKGRYISAIPKISRALVALLAAPFSNKKSMTGLTSGSKEGLKTLTTLIEQGHMRTLIDKTFAMDQIIAAHKAIENGEKVGNMILNTSN